ncbi:putative histone acetyltransferase chromatin regulator PHD family [Helianthus annuus]|uniref:Histone acetyltransferase chromatin regulator PHD family n=1 Tax=Helianthus annuus TaxID=4232 RepID=A0A251TES3_HELAN|nr:increased DNA methylation 1 isoform X1 [Helianthus annuus]KAF5784098.1 putative histone acetyltransferase chromatin regulator PHD family [Helianthus annuus]KAJ0519290.1 putative histone acetyltransferase chromatin regulator PHD family [Helianthus annuus]
MKRELAFALEARSQFNCFSGRTRSSKSSPESVPIHRKNKQNKQRLRNDRVAKSVEEVRVNRRNKRIKTPIPVIDDVSESAPAAEAEAVVVDGGEESAAVSDVINGGDEAPAVEVAKKGSVEKVYVKRKKSKVQVDSGSPKRFTRSALAEKETEKEENVEGLGTPSRKNLEMKMSKKIGLGRMPTNMRELLETGLLEGFRVSYNYVAKASKLQGVIKGVGILCSCSLCEGTKVISPSQFEMHACKLYRHAIKHIRLENGKSLLDVIEICKASALEPAEVALQTVIRSLPVKGPSMCIKCNGLIEGSSTENMLVCDSCVDRKQVEAEPCVATRGQLRASSPDPKVSESNSSAVSILTKNKRGRKRKSESVSSKASSPDPKVSSAVSILTKNKRGRKRKSESISSKSSKSALKTVRRARKFKFSGNKIKNSKILKRSPRSASAPRPIVSVTKCTSSLQKSGPKLTKKNLSLHSPVFKEGGLPDGTELTYVARGKKCLDGYKLGNAIFCSCCKTEISASQFEAHAGWASRRKPYDNIYMSNGVSLHDYAVSLKNAEDGRGSLSSNDDVCKVCGEGGDLLLCDGCPRSFHKECAEETSIPRGKWYCKICQHSMKTHGENENALAAGRIAGVNPIELNMTRCIRIIKHSENSDLCACVLCRCHDFTKCVFNDRTVIVCDQCEREYHIGCLRERNMADLKALPKGEWFCCNDCKRINLVLKNLLAHEPETLRDDMLTIVKERQKNDSNNSESETTSNPEIKFVVLRGKNAPSEARKLLAQAVNIFHEGFDPIVDATSGRDFIPSMVYGRKIWSQDFAGMLCAILTVDSKVVTAGTLRVFGEDLAELPIVATSKCNQGKGYFQLLFTCIERLLSSLKVKKIVLPAAEEAKSIWTNKFGFETILPDQLNELRQSCSAMMTFQGTSMLQKEILQVQDGVADAGDNGGLNPLVE